MRKPRLVPHWRKVLRHATSVHLNAAMIVLAAVTGIESAWPVFAEHVPIPPGLFIALSGAIPAAAILARLIYQRKVHD
jgi:hypothetical protein